MNVTRGAIFIRKRNSYTAAAQRIIQSQVTSTELIAILDAPSRALGHACARARALTHKRLTRRIAYIRTRLDRLAAETND